MKQFATLFTHGVRNGGELRQAVHHSQTGAEILDCVETFFARSAAVASD
jgi:tRNA-dihydrouridine synthase B